MSFYYHYFSDKPFVRLVIPYILGILAFRLFSLTSYYCLLALLFIIFLSLFFLNIIIKYSIGKEIWWGILLSIFLFFLGYFLAVWIYPKYQELNYLKEKGLICGTVAQKVEVKEKYVKAVIEIKAIKVEKNWHKSEGKSIVFFNKDEKSLSLNIGDELLINTSLNEPKNLGNPNEFDYKKYLAFHFISSSAFIKADEWIKIYSDRSKFSIVRYAQESRDYLLSILKKMNLPDDVFAVASSTIFGYHNEIDAEIKQAYSSAGAIHILAVSGFQVGVIYLILQYLLFPLVKKKYFRWLFLIITLIVLWFYAFITGLSPSVLRATTMFSFMVVANFINRQTNIYNTIAASAFFLLLINPLMLFNIGFQLSYAAVIGIVYFQPKLKYLWHTENKILDVIWSLLCVTIAAQLTTTPLSLYYFHQFPVYFILSGIILVPLVSVVIYVTFVLYVFSFFTTISDNISLVLNYLVSFMNKFVFVVEDLPYSVIDGVYINIFMMCLLYLILIFISLFFAYKSINYLKLSLVCLWLIIILLIVREIDVINQRKIIVYNIPGKSTMNLIDGKDNVLFVDDELKENEKKYTKASWVSLGLNKEKTVLFQNATPQFLITNLLAVNNDNVWFYRNFYGFYNFKILVINNDAFFKLPEKITPIKVDLILVQRKAKVNFNCLLSVVKSRYIIFDSSCPQNKVKLWKEQLKNALVNVHDVSKEGAWVINL